MQQDTNTRHRPIPVGEILEDELPELLPESDPVQIIPAERSLGPIKLRELGIIGGLSDLNNLGLLMKAEELIVAKIDIIARLRIHAISLTTNADWISHLEEGDDANNAIPYLQGSGCLKLRDPMRVEIQREQLPEITIYNHATDHEYYMVQYEGRARSLMFSPLWHQVSGIRVSKDPFFTKAGSIEANPGDVIKAAATNLTGGAIRKVLGLERPDWEWLRKAGLDIKRIQSRAIKRRSRGAARGPANQARAMETLTKPMLAIKLKKDEPTPERFLFLKEQIKSMGADFNPDGSYRWFLDDNEATRKLISNLDLIGVTEELTPHA